jgi:DNA (cytosine-5)-methyltransferase 1
MARRLRLVDLFAGCGGLTRGFLDVNLSDQVQAEYHVLAAVEADRAAAATYAANFGRDHLHPIKIEDWEREDIPSADVVIGGPPCQGFSNLGRRDPSDPRNVLWREYARTLERIRPDYFVIENVAAFFRSPQWSLLQAEVEDGSLIDYVLQASVLNAADYGVPQTRKRAVVIGRRRAMPPLRVGDEESEERSTVRDALACLSSYVSPDAIALPPVYFEFDGVELPGAFKTSDLHLTRSIGDVARQRIESVPPGGNRMDIPDHLLPDCWRRHRKGSLDVMGRLRPDRPAVTIRTEFMKPEKGRYLHPTEQRPLTHAEAALLQTFPMDFQWCGSKVAIAKQIGNAVPVGLARAIGTAIARVYV